LETTAPVGLALPLVPRQNLPLRESFEQRCWKTLICESHFS
jgi:hypothetical protein